MVHEPVHRIAHHHAVPPSRRVVTAYLPIYIRHGYSQGMPRPDPRDFLPLSPVVLHVLLALAAGERHGYAIAREVEETTGGQVRMGPGTLYGSIQRMLAAGLIDAARRRHAESDDERRRYYRITPLGRRALELEVERLARVVRQARASHILPDPEPA